MNTGLSSYNLFRLLGNVIITVLSLYMIFVTMMVTPDDDEFGIIIIVTVALTMLTVASWVGTYEELCDQSRHTLAH